MAKITRTQQRRLAASSFAFIMTAAMMMMPTTTDARGGGHGSGGFHTRSVNILGFTNLHATPAAGFVAVRRTPRRVFTQHRFAFRRSRGIASHFVNVGADGLWVDSFEPAPTIIVVQQPENAQAPLSPHRLAPVVKAPDAEQEGILVVRGNSKAYVTFPTAKSG